MYMIYKYKYISNINGNCNPMELENITCKVTIVGCTK